MMAGKGVWITVVAGLVLLALALSDPFGWHAARLKQAREEARRGSVEARYRQAEREAQQALALRQAQLQQQQKALSEQTDRAVTEAREQPDAKTALGDDRMRRLREHDRSLCEQGAGLAGCAAATGSAR